jgi:small subunit ribosomal protein S27Ae
MAKEKKTRKRGKRVRKGRKHSTIEVWKKYEIKGETVTRKNSFCPRCGGGVWLSKQKNRLYCGKCGYTSFSSPKSEAAKAEAAKTEAAKQETRAEHKG